MGQTLVSPSDHAPLPQQPAAPRDEVLREFEAYRQRGRLAFATGDWDQWTQQFTLDARYFEHHYGRFEGRDAIRNWIVGVMQPFPQMDFPVNHVLVDGNRVVMSCNNRLPGGFGFDVATILHYAGNGQWSYEEDVYNPEKAHGVITAWTAAQPAQTNQVTP